MRGRLGVMAAGLLWGCGGGAQVEELAAGGTRSCVRRGGGEILCWGGRLLTGGSLPVHQGSKVPKASPPLENPTSLCVGEAFVCARRGGGQVSCLGPGPDARWEQVAGLGQQGLSELRCSDGGGCGVEASGEVRCWDWTSTGPGAAVAVPGLGDARAVAVGGQHRCAVRGDESVWCWGRNADGQLGVSPVATAASAAPIQAQGLATVRQVAAGRDFTCALGADGRVRCFGNNTAGQLGYPGASSFAAVEVAGVEDAVAVRAGERHACALLGSGELRCWGRNLNGQLGDLSQVDRKEGVRVAAVEQASLLGTGAHHSCALSPSGLWCWGNNSSGQVGDGSFEDRLGPVEVALPGR